MRVCLRLQRQGLPGAAGLAALLVLTGGWGQQGRQIQLLVGIEHRADGRGLERQPVYLQRLLVAVECDAGQRQLLEAGKFVALAALEMPVIEGQLALESCQLSPCLPSAIW